jgi:DNA-binding GntR family transcriptional regulator
VSRGSLREAIRRLSAEGIVEVLHNRGAKIRRLSQKEILDLYTIREALESLAAQLAADSGSQKGKRELKKVMREAEAAVARGDAEKYVGLNELFHETVVELAGNSMLSQLIRQLHTPVLRFQLRSFMNQSVLRQSHHDHEKIAAAIYAGDGAAARRAMQGHIRRSAKFVEREG